MLGILRAGRQADNEFRDTIPPQLLWTARAPKRFFSSEGSVAFLMDMLMLGMGWGELRGDVWKIVSLGVVVGNMPCLDV